MKKLHVELLLAFGLRGGSAVASFGITWLIARQFGAEQVGFYQLGVATATLFSMFVSMGLDVLLVREAGHYLAAGAQAKAKAAYLSYRRILLLLGVAVTVLLAAFAYPLSRYVLREPEAAVFIILAAPIALILPLMKLSTAMLRTVGKVIASQSLEGVSYSTITLAGIAIGWLWLGSTEPLLPSVLFPASMALTTLLALWLTAREIRDWPTGQAKVHVRAGLSIFSGQIVIHAANWLVLVIIAAFLTIADAGLFRVAYQVSMLFQLVHASFSVMIGPHLAKAAATGERGAIVHIMRGATGVGLLLSSIPALTCLLFPDLILGIFGPEFRTGALAMQLMVVAQLVNILLAPSGIALLMMHREKDVMTMSILGSVAMVAAALLTVPSMGMLGAAIAYLAGETLRNLGLFMRCRSVLAGLVRVVPAETEG